MPEPIMLPITNAIALARPMPLTNSCALDVASDTMVEFFVTKPLLVPIAVNPCVQDAVSEVI
jgi:hypothetical protein